jgi:hypothetical protein
MTRVSKRGFITAPGVLRKELAAPLELEIPGWSLIGTSGIPKRRIVSLDGRCEKK